MIPIYLLRKLRYASEYYRKFSSEILKEKEIEKRRERIKKLKEHLEKKRAFVQTKKKVEKEKKEEQKVIKAEKVEIKEAKIEMPPMPQVVPTRAAVSEEKVESVSTKEKEETKEPKISIKVLPPPEPSKEKAAVPKEVTILAAPVAPTYIPPFLEEGGLRLKVKEAMKLPETMRKEEKKIKFDITKVDDRYPLVKVEFEGEERDMAYAHITWVEKEHKLKYFVEEPTLSEEEKKIFNRVVGYLREKIEVDFARIRKKEVYEILKNNFVKVLKIIKKNVTKDEIFKYLYFLKRNILGLGKIEPLMHDPYIEDISCLPSFEKVLIVDFREGIAQFLTIPEIIEKYREDLRIVKAMKKYVMFTFENRELYTLSFDLKNKKVTFDKIKYIIIKKNIPKKIVRIKLEKGLQISVTPDHKVLVYDKNKNKILFKYAGDIREGDILVGINKEEINFEENTIEYINLIDVFNKGKENIGEERYKKIRVLGWTKVMKNLDIINKVAKDLNIPKYNIYNWIKSDSIPLYVYSYMRERYSKFMKKENEKNLYLAYNSGYKNKIKAVIDNLKDLAFILGLYIAEGWVNENGILFSFNKREKVLIAELVNKVKKCFGNVTISIKASRIWNSVTVYVGGVLLKLLFIDVWKLGKDSYSKRMPSFIFKTNKKVKLELIGAYILGDGYINSEKAKISIITASSKLVDDLTLLFLEFGIILPAYKRNDKFGRGFEINILGEDAKKLMNLLKWKINMRNTGTNRVYLIPKELVINSPYAQLLTATQKKILRKISYKTSYLSNKIKEIFTPNLNFFRVKEIQIEEYKEKYVYDITTEKYHNFLHRGLIFSHNCDGVGIPIFVYHKKPMYGQLETNIVFNTKDELDSFVYKLAQICGKSISLAKPLLDGVLPDGSRVQATLGSDIARRGSNFTIRKFTYRPLSPTDLMLNGTASEVVFAYLWLLIENNFSVLIAGATATGKTTFLNAVSLFIRPDAKIISIEDTPELRLPHENWVPEVERAPVGGESYGAVTMYDLLKAALRKRPDYIIVGEVRGKEANVLFHGMETGHPALGTIHADNFDALVDRLTSPPINLATQRLQSLDAVVFMTRFRLGRQYVRRVREIVEIIGYDRGRKRVKTNVAFEWDHTTDTFIPRKSFLLERVRELMNMKPEEFKKEFYRRVKLLRWLKEKKIVDYVEFSKYIRRYYLDPTFVDKLKI